MSIDLAVLAEQADRALRRSRALRDVYDLYDEDPDVIESFERLASDLIGIRDELRKREDS